jgi:hypothetical protein
LFGYLLKSIKLILLPHLLILLLHHNHHRFLILLILISSAHFPFIFLTLLLFIFIQVLASVFSPAPLFFAYLDQLSSELVVILSHFEGVSLHLKLIAFAAFEQLIVFKLYFNFKLVFLSLVELELVREQIYFLY